MDAPDPIPPVVAAYDGSVSDPAFYLADGDRFVPTELTCGPPSRPSISWSRSSSAAAWRSSTSINSRRRSMRARRSDRPADSARRSSSTTPARSEVTPAKVDIASAAAWVTTRTYGWSRTDALEDGPGPMSRLPTRPRIAGPSARTSHDRYADTGLHAQGQQPSDRRRRRRPYARERPRTATHCIHRRSCGR
jgi:hypothetical protein